MCTASVLGALAAPALWLLVAPMAAAQAFPDPLHAFLEQQMLLSPADFTSLKQGYIVSTLPATRDPRETAAFGVVRVNAPGAAFVDAVLDVETYMRNSAVLQLKRFSTPSLPMRRR